MSKGRIRGIVYWATAAATVGLPAACGGAGSGGSGDGSPDAVASTDGGARVDGGGDAGPAEGDGGAVDAAMDAEPPLAPALPDFVRRTTLVWDGRLNDDANSSTVVSSAQADDRSYVLIRHEDVVRVGTDGQVQSFDALEGARIGRAATIGEALYVTGRLEDGGPDFVGRLSDTGITAVRALEVDARPLLPADLVEGPEGAPRIVGVVPADDTNPSELAIATPDGAQDALVVTLPPETVTVLDSPAFRGVAAGAEDGLVIHAAARLSGVRGFALLELAPDGEVRRFDTYAAAEDLWLSGPFRTRAGYVLMGRLGSLDAEDADPQIVMIGLDRSLDLSWAHAWDVEGAPGVDVAVAPTTQGLLSVHSVSVPDAPARNLILHVSASGSILSSSIAETDARVTTVLRTDDGGYLASGAIREGGIRNPVDLWQMHFAESGSSLSACTAAPVPFPLPEAAPLMLDRAELSAEVREGTLSQTMLADVGTAPLDADLYDRVLCGDGAGTWQDEGEPVRSSGCECPPGALCYGPATGCDMGLVCVGHYTSQGNPTGHCSIGCGTSCPPEAGTCHLLEVDGDALGGWCY